MKLQQAQKILMSSSLAVFLAGCGAPNYAPSESHITVEEVDSERVAEPDNIPSLVSSSPAAPVLAAAASADTFDVVVTNVPVRDLLFALARDSGLNMDVDDNVGGLVTMSALDQTLDAILTRIQEQVAVRVEYLGDAIIVKQDTPYTKIYRVDYLNIARSYESDTTSEDFGASGAESIENTSENDFWAGLRASVETILQTEYEQGRGFRGAIAGFEQSQVVERDRLAEIAEAEYNAASPNIAARYNLNSETGVLTVFASERVQKLIQELLDNMVSIAKRQVLLEATVVEVVLSNQYEQGIDWSVFNSLAENGLSAYQGGNVGAAAAALSYLTDRVTEEFTSAPIPVGVHGGDAAAYFASAADRAAAQREARRLFDEWANGRYGQFDKVVSRTVELEEIEYDNAANEDAPFIAYRAVGSIDVERLNEEATRRNAGGLVPRTPGNGIFQAAFRQGDLSAAVNLLDSFGDAKVLSSPRISAINQQPALLRVVDQEVYFQVGVDEQVSQDTGQVTSRNYSVTSNTVDIGFSMGILPQVGADGEIILNLKPSVTRVLDYRQGFVPTGLGGATGNLQNLIPITRVRELESVISLRDGEVAVLGGLLEDRTGDNNRSVPGLGKLPGIGALFSQQRESTFKTEFVVFIRGRVIKNPSLNGDYSHLRHLLPSTDFIIRDREGTFLPPAPRDGR